MELTPLQKIDYVLNYFKTSNSQIQNADTVAFLLNPKGQQIVTNEESLMIIEKLIKDGYVYAKRGHTGINQVSISFDGYLFHGYEEQERIDIQKQLIADQNEMRIVRNEKWLLYGTWVAGIVGALLLLWQVWIWHYPTWKDFSKKEIKVVQK